MFAFLPKPMKKPANTVKNIRSVVNTMANCNMVLSVRHILTCWNFEKSKVAAITVVHSDTSTRNIVSLLKMHGTTRVVSR